MTGNEAGAPGWQDFTATGDPATAAPRIAALRALMAEQDLDAVIVPRADAFQGEYVTDRDARLRWLTGFSGSAGFAIVTADRAGLFIDGRYRVQVRAETDAAVLTPVPWPETAPADWLLEALPGGGRVGFDPWLHTRSEIEGLQKRLSTASITLVPIENPVDAIWHDRPDPSGGPVRIHPSDLVGATPQERRARIAAELVGQGQRAAVLTQPDSIAWLLNIRGADVPRYPAVQAFAILGDDGHVALFADPARFDPDLRAHLGNEVSVLPMGGLTPALLGLEGPVRIDPQTAPDKLFRLIEGAGIAIAAADDPVALPKAVKTAAELSGMRAAHLRDAAAVVRCLAWIDAQAPGSFSEIDVVRQLERCREGAGARDLSFDTICGSGPNGAIVHYHVTEKTNRTVAPGELLLLDSGGQYADGTTDITRTMPVGPVALDARDPYTRVLAGMIALSRLRFPKGFAGRDIDPVARAPLWQAGLDYDHGTGHGVGAALGVHEGPARIARRSEVPIAAGMIFSNEPGYYREGAFGIRIENLIAVEDAESPDGRAMLGFETLTLVPIDTRLVDLDAGILSAGDIAWLDAYHARVRAELSPLLDGGDLDWLVSATRPLGARAAA